MAARQPYAFENETAASVEEVGKDLDRWMKQCLDGPVVITKRGIGKCVMIPAQVYREMIRRDIYNLTGIAIPFTPTFRQFDKVVEFLKKNPPPRDGRNVNLDQETVEDLEKQAKKYGCPPETVLTATMLCMMYVERLERYPSARRA